MFKWFLSSLNKKLVLSIVVGFFMTSVLFMTIFTTLYTSQLSKERNLEKEKITYISRLNLDNKKLRQQIQELINLVVPNDESQKKEINKKVAKLPKTETFFVETSGFELRYKALTAATRLVAIGGVVVILVVLGLWWLVNKFVVAPVQNLVEASDELAEGNLSARVHIRNRYSRYHDELGKLALAFNRMAESLQNSMIEIQRKESFQQSLIDAIPDAIRVIDDEYNIISANAAYKQHIGIDKLEPTTKCYKSSHKNSEPCPSAVVTCPIREIRKNAKSIKCIQKFTSSEGRETYVEVSAAPIVQEEDSNPLIVESIRDLTHDINFSHQQKLSSVGLLATSVAHEMRNPLGSIRLIIEGLVDKIDRNSFNEDEIKKYLVMVNDQLASCIDVTERLLKMAKFNEDVSEEVDIKDAIIGTLSLLDYEAKKNGISLTPEIEGDSSLVVLANNSEIRMVLVNLIQNAFHAIESAGEVKVSAHIMHKDTVELKISDNGKGIDPSIVARIFEPFYSSRKNNGGTGLGLTITKNIIERFGGKITAESSLGKGTSFIIELPLKK